MTKIKCVINEQLDVKVGEKTYAFRDSATHVWYHTDTFGTVPRWHCYICGKRIRSNQYYINCRDKREFHVKCDPSHINMCAIAGD